MRSAVSLFIYLINILYYPKMVKMAGQLVAPQYDRERRTFYAEERIVFLDGIRGLAILLVGIGHFFYDFYIFKFTWIGLNLFFVLSGYLITSLLLIELDNSGKVNLLGFWRRRDLRPEVGQPQQPRAGAHCRRAACRRHPGLRGIPDTGRP